MSAEQDRPIGVGADRFKLFTANIAAKPMTHQEKMQAALALAGEKVTQYCSNEQLPRTEYASWLWRYAEIACDLKKFSLALDAYSALIKDPQLREKDGASYYGRALIRAFTIHFNEQKFDDFQALWDLTFATGPELTKGNKCCIALLCSGFFAATQRPSFAEREMNRFAELIGEIRQNERDEIVPFAKELFRTFESLNLPSNLRSTGLCAVVAMLEMSDLMRARTQVSDYYDLKLESARLLVSFGHRQRAQVELRSIVEAFDRLGGVDDVAELQLRKSIGYLFSKIGMFEEALQQTHLAASLDVPTADLRPKLGIGLQCIDLLCSTRQGARALADTEGYLELIEYRVGKNLPQIIDNNDHTGFLKKFERARNIGEGEQFLQLMEFYSSFLFAKAIILAGSHNDLDALREIRQKIQFIDEHLEVQSRVNKLVIEEAELVSRREEGEFAEVKWALGTVFDYYDARNQGGSYEHAQAGFLMALLTVRELRQMHREGEEIEYDPQLISDIESYLEAGNLGIHCHKEARRFFQLAKLYSYKGSFLAMQGEHEQAAEIFEAAKDALTEGGFRYCELRLEFAHLLVKLYQVLGETERMDENLVLMQEINAKLAASNFDQA